MNNLQSLKAQINYQRELGNNKLADILCEDLASERLKIITNPDSIPQSWIKENQIPREEDGLINFNSIMRNWIHQLEEEVVQ